tara:strand:- start:305 stop:616 length:312 start_codon:yes stop_codon:yes gene_type:complete
MLRHRILAESLEHRLIDFEIDVLVEVDPGISEINFLFPLLGVGIQTALAHRYFLERPWGIYMLGFQPLYLLEAPSGQKLIHFYDDVRNSQRVESSNFAKVLEV